MTRPYVLLVDDLPANLAALEALFQADNVALLKAGSGEEALELLLKHDVALALLDVQMPGMDGFELAELMRGTERTRNVPIIFLTAGSVDKNRRFRGYEAGAVDFIPKPIEGDVLRRKVHVFVDLHQERQEVAAERDDLADRAIALTHADDAKDQFLAVLAHELRNPVAALASGLDLLERPRTEDQAAQIRNQMRRMVTHLSRLVEDLLDVTRIKEGKVPLQITSVDMQDVVGLAVEGTRHAIDEAGHRLYVDVPRQPLTIRGDYSRLAQVIANLLSNAAKYTPQGGTIRLTLRQESHGIELRITDTGVGIPAEMQTRIFEKFVQVEGHGARAQGGVGIGLALVKKLVALHGGTIRVESLGEGRGSTFIVSLPQSA